jgi:phosphate transport system substrate-binding protein
MKKRNWFFMTVIALFLMISTHVVWAESLVIKGSTTVLPIAQMIAESYMKEFPKMNISISGGGSGNGIKALIDGTCDIADSSRFIKNKEVQLAIGRGVYPVPFRIAYDCNWKELGGPNRKVVVVSRDTSSGTYEVWEKKVMNKERIFPGALLQASNGAVVQTVAKNKNAIGYIGLGYLNTGVKPLTVDGIMGSQETTLNGSYPISRPLFMFTPGWPNEEVIGFINYVLNPQKGQQLVKKVGFVPLN